LKPLVRRALPFIAAIVVFSVGAALVVAGWRNTWAPMVATLAAYFIVADLVKPKKPKPSSAPETTETREA